MERRIVIAPLAAYAGRRLENADLLVVAERRRPEANAIANLGDCELGHEP
jgi:hypothetical protein